MQLTMTLAWLSKGIYIRTSVLMTWSINAQSTLIKTTLWDPSLIMKAREYWRVWIPADN
jgi:hypothetical protein